MVTFGNFLLFFKTAYLSAPYSLVKSLQNMSQAAHSVSVDEAIEELEYPSFFDTSERKAAYEYIMLWGSPEEKQRAQLAKEKYPFENEEQPPRYS